MGQAIAVRTDFTAGEVRRFAQRATDAAQARRLLAIAAVAPAQHLSLAGQNGEPRRRCSPSAPQWPGPWQTPSVCHLESCRDRFGNPLRVSYSAAWY